MGWWSSDIMGGDTPLDCKSILYEIVGVDQFSNKKLKASHFSTEAITQYLEKSEEIDDTINYQVLGVLMMGAKAPIDESLKTSIIDACENDEWGNEDEERKSKLNEFIDQLKKYDGTSQVIIKSKGLFQTIAEHVKEGKTRLVNKHVK